MDTRELTAEQEEQAQRLGDIVAAGARAEALQIGRLLASRRNSGFFGATEFAVRDAVHRIGTRALETRSGGAKKGVLRVQLRLPRVRGGCRLQRLRVENGDIAVGADRVSAGLLSLRPLSSRLVSHG